MPARPRVGHCLLFTNTSPSKSTGCFHQQYQVGSVPFLLPNPHQAILLSHPPLELLLLFTHLNWLFPQPRQKTKQAQEHTSLSELHLARSKPHFAVPYAAYVITTPLIFSHPPSTNFFSSTTFDRRLIPLTTASLLPLTRTINDSTFIHPLRDVSGRRLN
jgi:hypothetical protein